MNNLAYLLSCIRHEIPSEILNMAFLPQTQLGMITPSLDYVITNKVITNWVLRDCNVVSGIETIIDITNVKTEQVNMGLILHVGLGPTGGRNISSVLSVGYGYNAMAGGQPGIASALTEPLQTSDARCQLIGPNIVFVEGYTGIWLTNIRCVLENDAEFNNISPRALPLLSDMCTLATKAYIYNSLTIQLSNAVVLRGIDMARYMEMVNSYSEAAKEYRDILQTRWVKVNIMADRVSWNRHIRRIIPS